MIINRNYIKVTLIGAARRLKNFGSQSTNLHIRSGLTKTACTLNLGRLCVLDIRCNKNIDCFRS